MAPTPMSAKEMSPEAEANISVVEKVGWKERALAPALKGREMRGRTAKRTSKTWPRLKSWVW